MGKPNITLSEDLADIMPPEYQELVETSTYGKEDRGWKDVGSSKELIEQHSLCAGCPEAIAFRYILASLPAPGYSFCWFYWLYQFGISPCCCTKYSFTFWKSKCNCIWFEKSIGCTISR